jgi:hypothetical protein
MAWWMGLDKDIYVDVEEARQRFEARPYPEEGRLPSLFGPVGSRPTAVLARQVASPCYEVLWFARVARRHGYRPVVIEHRSDRFTVHNPYKRSLATLPIVVGRSRNGRSILRRQKVVDLVAAEGRGLQEVVTTSGEGLLDYHHRKLDLVMGAEAPQVIDLLDILPGCATDPNLYYLEFFKMLSRRLVLFEDFVADDQTAAFFQRTILPAYRRAVTDTGRVPQIARLVPGKRTSSPFWMSYPALVADDPSWVQRAPERAIALA